MSELASAASAFALLTDGAQVEIRPLGAEDVEAVSALHRAMSAENLYLRFFAFNRSLAERIGVRLCRPEGADHGALGAWLGGELVGVAEFEATGAEGVAEVAMAVADHMHHRGVGTLLLEHLASLARRRGVRAFLGDTLVQNTAMLGVFADAGLPVRREMSGGVIEVTMPLDVNDHYLDTVAERERSADVESLRPLLLPRSVAVVGAGRRSETVGRAVLDNLRQGGFPGPLYAVNPHAGPDLGGVVCVSCVAELPEPPDLVVIAVPASAVAEVAEQCGRRGVRSLVVITSGLTADEGHGLLAACHRHSMRLVGPNCLGIASPQERLNATFAAGQAEPGGAGVVVQSGGVGIALLEQLSRLGIGVSSFASVGDKYDVSANDLLMWWESDARTRLGVLHLESFGNPRKFARTARRVGRRMPLLTVIAGRSESGQRAAASHTAAIATPGLTRRALFAQAGIVATDSLGELVDVAALLAHQPFPRGPRVAVVSNAGGAGVLAADACADAGLTMAGLGDSTRRKLRQMLPHGAAVTNPIDTTAAVGPDVFHAALELIAADQQVDAVLVLIAPTVLGELAADLDSPGKPVAAVLLSQAEQVRVARMGVPTYAYPENAARALAHAWSYGHWRTRPPGHEPDLPEIRRDAAQAIIEDHLTRTPDGGWLPPDAALRMLEAYRIPVAAWRWAQSEDAAVYAAEELNGPVVLKAHVPGVIHKSEAGAIQLDLNGEQDVRRAYRWLTGRFGGSLAGVMVQAMADGGVEVLCGVVQEELFGPVVVFGLGGVSTEVLGDQAARLAPLTDVDAAELVHQVRAAPLLLGHRGQPAVDLEALQDTLLRLSRLAVDHPEIAELDLNPVIAGAGGTVAVDARIRLAPQRQWDPFLRRLR